MADKITIEELNEKVEELAAKLEALENVSRVKPSAGNKVEKVEIPNATFKLNKAEYRFTVAQYRDLGGVLVKSVDALKNAAELERLVTIKSGIITKVK